jgi:two-component sensor histidine kinase
VERIPAVRRAILANLAPHVALSWSALAVALPTALRWLIDKGEAGVPFVSYFPAVALAALFLGWRWATVVALASGAIANRLFTDAPLLFYASGRDATLVALFAASCAVLIWAGDSARRMVRALEAAKAREELLNAELLHRVKNLLATVNAMIVLTGRHSPPESYMTALSGRMMALERATDLLGLGETAPCELGRLVDTALAPFRAGENFMIAGPPCELPRDACLPLSLALHELATNAVKHGALSVPRGWVAIDWALARDGLLTLAWREADGPPVREPERRGMGTQLLRRQRGLDHVELHFRPAGVECAITIDGCRGR